MRTTSTSSAGSGGDFKENTPGLSQDTPPTPCCLSPSPTIKYPKELCVSPDESGMLNPDKHDPVLSPGNPDCGDHWSLNSPPAGILQYTPSGIATGSQHSRWCYEADGAGVDGGGDYLTSDHAAAAFGTHQPDAAVPWLAATPATPLDLQGGCKAPLCDKPVQVPLQSHDLNMAPTCQLLYMTPSAYQGKRARVSHPFPSPACVIPSRDDLHAAVSSRDPGSMVGWRFQLPGRTPFIVPIGRLHAALSDLDRTAKADSREMSNSASRHRVYRCDQEGQGEDSDSAALRCIRCGFNTVCWVLQWGVHMYPHCWDAATLALRTSGLLQQSRILLGAFFTFTASAWCGHMCMLQSAPCT